MADANSLLERLRGGGALGPLGRLARLAVDDVLARPLGVVFDPALTATYIARGILDVAASEGTAAIQAQRIRAVLDALASEARPLRAIVPRSVAEGAVALARLPAAPDRDALLKVLDREPVRLLLRSQTIDALAAFGRRAASPVADSTIARGLGGISKLALSSGKSALSRVASAVSTEVERQVERRASEFADTAVAGILAGIVEQVTDPARRDDQAAMRAAVVDGLFDLTGADLAGIARGDPAARVEAVREALRAWSAEPGFEADLRSAVSAVLARDAARPIGDVLSDFGIREAVRGYAEVWLAQTLVDVVGSEAFAEWLRELVG